MSPSAGSGTLDTPLISPGPQFFQIWPCGDGNPWCTGLSLDGIVTTAATCCTSDAQAPSTGFMGMISLHSCKIPSEEGLWGGRALKSAL